MAFRKRTINDPQECLFALPTCVSHGKHKFLFCFFIFTISKCFPLVSFRFVLLVLTRRREKKKSTIGIYLMVETFVLSFIWRVQRRRKKKETREKGCAVWGHKRVPISVASNERFKAPRVCGKHTQTTTETRILYTIYSLSQLLVKLQLFSFLVSFFKKGEPSWSSKQGKTLLAGRKKKRNTIEFFNIFLNFLVEIIWLLAIFRSLSTYDQQKKIFFCAPRLLSEGIKVCVIC